MRVQSSETRRIKANADICYKEALFSCVQNLMSSAFLSIVLQGTMSVHNFNSPGKSDINITPTFFDRTDS